MIRLSAVVERFETAQPFVIARGSKAHVDVIVARAALGGAEGRGEGTAIYYRGDSAAAAAGAVNGLGGVADRSALQLALPPGAARNAADCALWSLAARAAGVPVWRLAGLSPPRPVVTALTLSLGDPAAMELAARSQARHPLFKLKLAGDGGDADRVDAVRRGAPGARLIVDANEAWAELDIEAEAAKLALHGVALIEQPVPAGEEALLDGVRSAIPLCADESCHTRADLDRCAGRFGFINIKLDKAGGLTEGLALADEALTRGFRVMVGCMLSTSLGIAPALLVAQRADFVDLDGPLLLAGDRKPALRYDADGTLHPGSAGLWD